jgi:hypothetical protein
LTVEYEKTKTGSGLVEIHSDEEGAELLIRRFSRFVERAKHDYDHLMTPSWVGYEFTDKKAQLLGGANKQDGSTLLASRRGVALSAVAVKLYIYMKKKTGGNE